MAKRAEQVRLLAELLSTRPHSRPVTARWQVEPGEPATAGCWTLSWSDGPDITTMSWWAHELIAEVPRLAGLDGDAVWWWLRRDDSPAAWAALLLQLAGPDPGRTPAQWRSAQQLHDYAADLIDHLGWLDEPHDPGTAVAVAALVATSRGEALRMARMVLAEWRALPRAATRWEQQRRPTGRCEQCGALYLAKPGPPQRWCSPRCRLRHWRATHAAQASAEALTEPGNEPRCAGCARPLPPPTGVGRPARYCGPACRQFAHHHRRNDPDRAAAAYTRRQANPPTPPTLPTRPPASPSPGPAPRWAGAPVRKPRPPRPPLPVELEGCLAGSRTVHQLHLTVADIDPPIWRRLQVPSTMPLIRLSDVVCVVLDWSGEHLHAFTGVPGESSYAGVNPHEFALTVADLLPEIGWMATYTYDFGDWWQVDVTLEQILTRPQPRTFYPRATAGRRAGPAEDCGGVPGYQQLLTALRSRKGWRYRQAREQHPGWKPENFDLADINQQLIRWYLDQHEDSTRQPRLTDTPTDQPE